MSITHSLKFQSQRREEEILSSLLSSNIGLQPATYDEMKAEGLFGRVATISNISQQGFQEDYGLCVNIAVIFDETFEGDRNNILRVLGDVFTFLLKEETGDAMLFWVVDTPILKRIRGETMKVTNEPEFDWLRNAIDEANLKYELKSVYEIQKS